MSHAVPRSTVGSRSALHPLRPAEAVTLPMCHHVSMYQPSELLFYSTTMASFCNYHGGRSGLFVDTLTFGEEPVAAADYGIPCHCTDHHTHIFFCQFYLNNSYWETDPFIIVVAAEAHLLFSRAPSVVLFTLTCGTASRRTVTVERNLIAPLPHEDLKLERCSFTWSLARDVIPKVH